MKFLDLEIIHDLVNVVIVGSGDKKKIATKIGLMEIEDNKKDPNIRQKDHITTWFPWLILYNKKNS